MPAIVCRVLELVLAQLRPCQDLDCVEFFSGGEAGEAVTKGMAFFNLRAFGLEIKKDAVFHYFCSAEGFTLAICMVERLAPGGMSFLAPVCSNWIWLVRSVSGRCSAFPLGYEWVPDVAWSNAMVARVVLLLTMLAAKKCAWMIEQPLSSVLYLHPRFQWFLSMHCTYRFTLDMYQYGGDTAKPTVVYCSHPWFEDILRDAFDRPKAEKTLASREWCPVKEKFVVTGNADIKSSQHYPIAFGRCVARVYHRHREELRAAALEHLTSLSTMPAPIQDLDDWADANMGEVIEYAQSLH